MVMNLSMARVEWLGLLRMLMIKRNVRIVRKFRIADIIRILRIIILLSRYRGCVYISKMLIWSVQEL